MIKWLPKKFYDVTHTPDPYLDLINEVKETMQ